MDPLTFLGTFTPQDIKMVLVKQTCWRGLATLFRLGHKWEHPVTGQTCKTQILNTLNVKIQVILKADTAVYLFITLIYQTFWVFKLMWHFDVCNNGRLGSDVLSLLLYGLIWIDINLLTRAEIPHHTPRPPCSAAHPQFCWSGISNADKWFVVYFLMRRGDMGICSLKR